MAKQSVTVEACSNIALIKYWGKRNENLFLPTKSSLSVTLDGMSTTTTVSFTQTDSDCFILNGNRSDEKIFSRIKRFLDLFRRTYHSNHHYAIETKNNFPTAAGLASSASGFAALSFALVQLEHLDLSLSEISLLARQGSGSASRSLHGGFVLWHRGQRDDGIDSFAEELFPPEHWETFRVLVVILEEKAKPLPSRNAMLASLTTSPTYWSWVDASEQRIVDMKNALFYRDIDRVGSLAEDDCLGMHKTMHDSTPSVQYWTKDTEHVMSLVRKMRQGGIPCYFTIDAGPNVKILCEEHSCSLIQERIEKLPNVKHIVMCKVGYRAKVIKAF